MNVHGARALFCAKGAKKLAAAAVALALAVVVAATSVIAASFTAQSSATGTAKTGKVGIALSVGRVDAAPLVAGSTVENKVVATNTADRPCFVRIRVTYSIAETKLGALTWFAPESVAESGWVSAPDGWWYRSEPLEAYGACPLSLATTYTHFEQVKSGEGYMWRPVYGESDPSKWSVPSPDPADDSSLMTYEDVAAAELVATIECEAVQAENFNPDFSADAPWGDVAAETTTTEKAEAGK